MRALILAAGRGSRMGALGDVRPKCLVELDGRPLLDRQLAALRTGGAREIGIVRGYRKDMLNDPALTYFDNDRWAETNMVMSLACAAEWLRAGPLRPPLARALDAALRGPVVGCGNLPHRRGRPAGRDRR
jgi:choline kinase